jgi:hypothetical protein
MPNLILIKNFPNRLLAEMAQQSLEAEGILSLLKAPDYGISGSGAGGGSACSPDRVSIFMSRKKMPEELKILSGRSMTASKLIRSNFFLILSRTTKFQEKI